MGAISFTAAGSFTLDANATISVNGGAGTSHYDGSGAGGSGGAFVLRRHLSQIWALYMPKGAMH